MDGTCDFNSTNGAIKSLIHCQMFITILHFNSTNGAIKSKDAEDKIKAEWLISIPQMVRLKEYQPSY